VEDPNKERILTTMNENILAIFEAILDGDVVRVEKAVQVALDAGIVPEKILLTFTKVD
jgi:methanogenic corrinoid protein MtbC1